MPSANEVAVALFTEKAKAVSVDVVPCATLEAAVDYAVSVCDQKEFCQLLLPDSKGTPDADPNEPPHATVKKIAVVGLDPKMAALVTTKAKEKGIEIITEGLRAYMEGIDMSIAVGRFGIAETGTSVISTDDEDVQIASMICENFFLILPTSKMFATALDAAAEIEALLVQDAAYTSFITGSSRTSDIERVLTLGVHGPLTMHVALLEE